MRWVENLSVFNQYQVNIKIVKAVMFTNSRLYYYKDLQLLLMTKTVDLQLAEYM